MKKIILLISFGLYLNLFSQEILLHSHNDYLQKKPLITALEFKANSIEVDVAWFQGEIKVSHFPFALKNKPNLESLYLKQMLQNKDKLSPVMFLMIDIKSGDEKMLYELNKLIAKYDEIFTSRKINNANKIKVIISGAANRHALVKNKDLNHLFADGNPSNLKANINSSLMPLISANYARLSSEERLSLIEKAHQQGKKVRFWNTKDNKKAWEALLKLQVDFIGVDHLEKFQVFLRNRLNVSALMPK